MRIQNLAVIFVIIILPITLVLQAYIRNLTNVTNIEARYNEILMGSTYDAVRAYQMNTINNDYSGVNTSRQRDVKASVNSFFNSLATGLHKSGSTKAAMNEYVPALLFNLYDGFYVYGPYNNVASVGSDNDGDNTQDTTGPDSKKINNKRPFFNENVVNTENTIYGVKPFTYYSCEYAANGQYDITINYTLDNYIAVSGWIDDSTKDGITISGAGYYIDGQNTQVVDTVREFLNNSINGGLTVKAPGKNGSSDALDIKAETLGEYVSLYDRVYMKGPNNTNRIINDMNGAVYARYYRYINYNNTKYYFDDCVNTSNTTYSEANGTPPIFTLTNHSRNYISLDQLITLANYQGWTTDVDNNNGNPVTKDESYSVAKQFSNDIKGNPNWAEKYFKDVNPYYYYKKAKAFSDEMYKYLSKIDLSDLGVIKNNAFNTQYKMTVRTGEQVSNNSYIISDYTTKKVFDYKAASNNPELDSSAFNAHRMDVIAKTVESALIKTVSSLNDYYGSNSYIYEMPTISMKDWHSIANGITVAAFMQGVPIGNYKFFNNYCIIGNTTNKEFVSKDAIYIQPKVGELSLQELRDLTGQDHIPSVLGSMNNRGVTTYGATGHGESGFVGKLTYMNHPDVYKTQGLNYNTQSTVLTQHNPRCGELMNSTDSNFIAYRRNDYLIESYEHTYQDYRIGKPYGIKSGSTITDGGVSGKAAGDGYLEINPKTHEMEWQERIRSTDISEDGMWDYVNGVFESKGYNSANGYQRNIVRNGIGIEGVEAAVPYKNYVQQINYYPQYGSNAYECIISHNGYKFTYDQLLSNDADGAGVTDKTKFKGLSEAYATCLAREKEAQYKNLDPMNYHRIYMKDKTGKVLSIATRESGEEVGVVAFKGKGNDKWWINGTPGLSIPTTYTMPYHDIDVYYNGGDEDKVFGK
jgi:hypothetical protein